VREAFAAGRLSFAKVRALTRIADSANEQRWLEVAASATAAQLDRLVAACRSATRADAAARVAREKLTWRYDDDGTVVLTARLLPSAGSGCSALWITWSIWPPSRTAPRSRRTLTGKSHLSQAGGSEPRPVIVGGVWVGRCGVRRPR
jgi:hypothetical protein